MRVVQAPTRARSADRLSSSRFMRSASGQSRASASLIGADRVRQGVDEGDAGHGGFHGAADGGRATG